ncbi:hypothetical protein CBM2585_A160022 [Cupriavidus taiwanensis]|nr:hypothetical protein CBM2585_A160022 [Cupriavidus taiwanensis]
MPAVKHVVSGIVYEQATEIACSFGQPSRRDAIDKRCRAAVLLRLVHRCIGGRIDNDIGPMPHKQGSDVLPLRDIAGGTIQSDNFAQAG